MTRFPAALLVCARILLVWAAFHGAGSLLRKPVRKLAGALPGPPVVLGAVACLLLTFPLSAAHVMTRWLVAAITVILGMYGSWLTIRSIRFDEPGRSRIRPAGAAAVLILALLGLSTLFRAVKPQDHSDPLITYAVQPDRWLDAGHIFFLEETRFSAMPVLGETFAIWPASLALPGISGIPGLEDDDFERQTDQLSLLQVFQLSLLVAATILASGRLDGSSRGLFLSLTAVLASSMLTGWGSLAKVDMTLAFFTTLALLPALVRIQGAEERSLWPFLLFGMALSTKLTAWVLMPLFAAVEWISGRRRAGVLLAGMLMMLILPAAYMIRTYTHTGSLVYTGPMSFPDAAGIWEWNPVQSLDSLSQRTDPGLPVDVGDLALAWDYPMLLLVCGLLSTLKSQGARGRVMVAAMFACFACVSIIVFAPARWGAKYTLMVLPLVAAVGASWWPAGRRGFLLTCCFLVAVALGTEILPRARFILGFSTSDRMLTYDSDLYLSPRNLHLWANDSLPEDAVLLSLFSGERYHSEHAVICARTHPFARRLFEDGTLQQEVGILRTLGVDYVYFTLGDPMGMNLVAMNYWSPGEHPADPAEGLSILDGIGEGGLLEPVHVEDGTYVICRLNLPE